MLRTLALVLAVPAAAAPVFTRTPMEVQSVYLDQYTAGRSSEMGYSGNVVEVANPDLVHSSSSGRSAPFSGWLFLLGMMTGITAMLHLVIGLSVPAARSTSRIGECLGGFSKALLWTLPAAILGPLLLVPLFRAAVRLGQAAGALAALVMAGESHG